ncbi:MAG: cobalamin-dependent protein [Desulfobacterales bacterium]|jgi:corrinoid protein of di/trimethylamine methyltransferase|nr:cobalamin-binding protein [Desulfobacter sp.]MDP6179650.1 cobalamin-dependent protein [Desulfatiglandales bacterium]MDP6395594.1 cobalamin-dependent protein [Desulfobacterales bacterium]MDP6682250.1 cobalamin-dependent protein [Desulfobacterales bacterium]MDP6807113.1 cobalamin-dependent protein [Desulfobacterales bacterium]|tara:strand:+ start:40757 stop:41431 length:675 start_codon:yes stop_codon:yes gene_type:complete
MATEEVRQEILKTLDEGVVEYEEDQVKEAAQRALDEGVNAYDAVMNGLAAGMEKVGNLYDQQEYFVPELLMCADALYIGLDILKPHITVEDLGDKPKGQVVIGTVQGDVHDIGKNIIKLMFEVAGFTVHDLGRDVPLEQFVEEQLRTDSEIVALSAMMTTTMMGMKKVIEMIRERNPNVAIMLGGAPVTKDTADLFGADGYAETAGNAVQEAIKMISQLRQMQA